MRQFHSCVERLFFFSLANEWCECPNDITVCPRSKGQQGNASILVPIDDRPTLVYKPWSKLCPEDGSVISCFSDDGRIAVNSELSAASNIFAAGSVAKYPNHDTGHATVAGEGVFGGSRAGEIAANNMVKLYREKGNISVSPGGTHESILFRTYNSLPILRTDQVSTSALVVGSDSSLESIGIHALCVGLCDSETMSTHGFWWTNQSRSYTRRRSNGVRTKHERWNKYVYGSGVVYYLDRAGAIRGIMLWGLPFTDSASRSNLNTSLLQRMKDIIQSNGEVIEKDYHSIIEEAGLDPSLLSPLHLAQESRSLVSLAVQDFPDTFKMLNRPQHRYVPSKPVSVTKMGVLKKRKTIGNGGSGEDLFELLQSDKGYLEGERVRHPSLVHYFQYEWNTNHPILVNDTGDEGSFDNINEGGKIHFSSKYPPDLAARPPKEEPLWMRQGEMSHTQSTNEKLSAIFMHNMKHGHFSDGSDAVKQAPVPQIVKDAKAWMSKNKEN
jgi:hypothetical protein